MNEKDLSLVLADASGELSALDYGVRDAVSLAREFISRHFALDWRINVVATSGLRWLVVPEDGVGGKAYASDFVVLAIGADNSTKAKAAEMLVHELAHAVRWGKNPEWSKDLFCELVSEGLAVAVEAEFARIQDEKTFFLETILGRNEEENQRLYTELKPHFRDRRYDYDGIFFGNETWPRWAGYSVGYYIVQKYLEKITKSIFEEIDVRYEKVRGASYAS